MNDTGVDGAILIPPSWDGDRNDVVRVPARRLRIEPANNREAVGTHRRGNALECKQGFFDFKRGGLR